jgi:phospholipid/cholesterol/gamma-HCH transport system substrate-binding protein
MRKIVLVAVVLIAAAILVLFGRARLSSHKIELKTYFQGAQGLRAGATVRVAGVDIGSVRSIRVRPELRENPAEVIMDIRTPYELKIPRDSVVTLETEGVLGATFAEIDVTGASGEPATNGAVLKSKQTEPLSQQLIDKVGDIIRRMPCEPESTGGPTTSGNTNGHKSERVPLIHKP